MSLGLVLAPAASATFTGTSQASASFSTATLAAPTNEAFPVTAQCVRGTPDFNITVSVGGGVSVQYANYLELKVKDVSAAIFTGDVNGLPNRTFSTTVNARKRDVYTFELRGKYVLPGQVPAAAWTSPPLTGTFTCA